MKKTLLALAALAGIMFHAEAKGTIKLKDYMNAESAADAMPALRAALDACAATRASELVLPGDTLRISPEYAYEKYEFISNNDHSLKRVAFLLKGMKDFTVKGNGTVLLFSGYVSPFDIEDCSNIKVEDITIDYTRPFVSEGTVVATGSGWFEFRFPEWYKVKLVRGNLRFYDNEGNEYPYSNLLEFDSQKKEVAYHAHDYGLGDPYTAAVKTDSGTYRIYRSDFGDAKTGNVMAFGADRRLQPGFTLFNCNGFNIKNVNMYNCCGMGVIAQCSSDIELRNMRVEPRPGSDQIISISADATHFVNCKGYIRMLDCVFKNQKDDATNIHGWYMAIDKILAADKVEVRWKHEQQVGVQFLKKGMTLEIVNSQDMNTCARRQIKDVHYLNSDIAEITFTSAIPSEVKPGYVVADDDGYPDVLISGCYIGNNRARGLLIGSRGKVVIEKNTFHTPGSAILFEGDGRYWFEQSGVRDVTIRDNVFDNCMYGASSWGSAVISVGSGIPDKEHSRYHRNITVENNLFRGFDYRLVNLYSVDGFTFRNNRVEMTDDYPKNSDEAHRFIAVHCDNVSFE